MVSLADRMETAITLLILMLTKGHAKELFKIHNKRILPPHSSNN